MSSTENTALSIGNATDQCTTTSIVIKNFFKNYNRKVLFFLNKSHFAFTAEAVLLASHGTVSHQTRFWLRTQGIIFLTILRHNFSRVFFCESRKNCIMVMWFVRSSVCMLSVLNCWILNVNEQVKMEEVLWRLIDPKIPLRLKSNPKRKGNDSLRKKP